MKWIKNPSTNCSDTMLSLAVWGFMFCIGITACSLFYLVTTGQSLEGLSNVSILVGTIMTSTIGAYTARKWTDVKYGNGHSVEREEQPTPIVGVPLDLPPVSPEEEGKDGV